MTSQRKILIAGMWLNLLACGATAETTIITPDPCPVRADAPVIIAGGDIRAVDLNTGRRIGNRTVVIYDASASDGWASRRLFTRFSLDRDTGLPVGHVAEQGCAG